MSEVIITAGVYFYQNSCMLPRCPLQEIQDDTVATTAKHAGFCFDFRIICSSRRGVHISHDSLQTLKELFFRCKMYSSYLVVL